MHALEHFAFDHLQPTWQHLKLLILFEQLFVSTEFQTLLLFYDNSTVDLAQMLLQRNAHQPRQHHDIVLYNIERHMPESVAFTVASGYTYYIDPPLVPPALAPCFARSVSIEIFADHHNIEVSRYRMDVYRLQPLTKWIRIYLLEAVYFRNLYRYMALIELLADDEVRVSTYNFQQQQPLQLFADSPLTMYQQLFFDQRIDMLGLQLYMWGDMDAPNLFRATAFDAQGRKVSGVAGMYASICSLIGHYFNASIAFTKYEVGSEGSRYSSKARLLPGERVMLDEKYKESEHLRNRVYRAMFVMPGIQITIQRCSLFDEFNAHGNAMYPHRQENFVVLVPNERQHAPELWMLISGSPLTTVWMGAIILYTLTRYVIHFNERLRWRRSSPRASVPPFDPDRVYFETCGLAFGWSIKTRPCGRADRVLIVSISLFAIVSGVFCSGMLMKQFAFGELKPKIDTLSDLACLSNMTVLVPKGLVINETTWNANHTLVETKLPVIYGEILRKNTRCTYVLPESVADVLLSEPHMSEEEGKFPVFHKLRERVLSIHMSMYTTEEIILHPLSVLMQRMRYMGLISYFEHQQQLTLGVRGTRATLDALDGGPASMAAFGAPTASTSITLRELSFIVWMVFVGQVASVAVFGAELLVARVQQTARERQARTRVVQTRPVLPFVH